MTTGTQDAADATVETLHAIEHPLARSAEILVDVCSFAGTGNVLKVQQMLQICAEHAEKPKPKEDGEDDSAERPFIPGINDGTAASRAAPTPGGTADEAMEQDGPENNAESSTAAAADAEAAAEKKAKEMRKQSMATIGIALIAMGEEVGAEMALRQFQHLVSDNPSPSIHWRPAG